MPKSNYKSLAAAILLQAQKDLDAFPIMGIKKANHNALCEYGKLLEDIERFLESDWCQTLCQLADIDHRMYTKDMDELFQQQKERYNNEKQKVS